MAWREASIVSQRLEFVTLASAEGANVRELCRRFGISAPTGYKWMARYRDAVAAAEAAGPAGARAAMQDRSRRPRTSPERSSAALEAAVLAVRERHPAWGARKIRAVLAREAGPGAGALPAVSTVHAILVRRGRIDPREGLRHRAWERFEHDRPNALWQMDFKGHVAMQRGRCHPLTILDDHSRFSLGLWACVDERSETVRGRLELTFRRFGLPERLLCDNGPPWGTSGSGARHTRLTVWLLRLGVPVTHGRAYHPQTQGRDERFHRTLKAELLGRLDLRDAGHAQAAFDAWRGTYNLERPHEALGMGVPASRYRASERGYPERLPEVEYAPGEDLRRVRHDGSIRWGGENWMVGEAFAGEWVAVRRLGGAGGEQPPQVCYGPHPVGRLSRGENAPPPGRRPRLAPLASPAGREAGPNV